MSGSLFPKQVSAMKFLKLRDGLCCGASQAFVLWSGPSTLREVRKAMESSVRKMPFSSHSHGPCRELWFQGGQVFPAAQGHPCLSPAPFRKKTNKVREISMYKCFLFFLVLITQNEVTTLEVKFKVCNYSFWNIWVFYIWYKYHDNQLWRNSSTLYRLWKAFVNIN